jgi:SAM-dependent methyltransferase
VSTAGNAALRAYRGLGPATRLHARVRWASAPFPAVEAQVPRTGAILEIGCGHGLFCTYLALTGFERRIVGVDIDTGKIGQAQLVGEQFAGDRLRFATATSGTVEPGPWDAVVIIDMLYLLPAEQQCELLLAAADQLAPGGVLLVKEMGTAPAWKARWNTVQETLAVSVLGITERAATGPATSSQNSPRFDFVPPPVMAGWLEAAGLQVTGRRLDRHLPHPHHLLVARRPG